jgi:hypothetical protein
LQIQLQRGRSEKSPLWLFEYPQPNARYYIGADAARGVEDGDFSAAVGFNGHTGEQAFTWANREGVEVFAYHLNLLGHFFNRAMLNIEVTGGDGAHTQKLLRDKYRYPTWYLWRGRDDKRTGRPRADTLGYETQWRSRQRLLVSFREGISSGACLIRDRRIFQQMSNAVRDDPLIRWEVTKGHDDIFMAAMLGWKAIDDYPPPKIAGMVVTNTMEKSTQQPQAMLPFQTEPCDWVREKFRVTMKYTTKRARPMLEGV